MFHFHVLVTQFTKLWHILSSTYISKNVLKCILKHVVFQYYAMMSKNFLMLIIDLNNIHEFNILRYTLWILLKKTTSVFNWHTLPCLCPTFNMFKYVNNIYFSKKILTICMKIYRIYWLHWIDLWINYKIVLQMLHMVFQQEVV
jgi:hypothetical protein